MRYFFIIIRVTASRQNIYYLFQKAGKSDKMTSVSISKDFSMEIPFYPITVFAFFACLFDVYVLSDRNIK